MVEGAAEPKIGVIGLGYVGLPLALVFARSFKYVVGFDISEEKISQIKAGVDPTAEGFDSDLKGTSLNVTNNIGDLSTCSVFIVTVPTPVDVNNTPDLKPLVSASLTLSSILKRGDIVVYESTVYPGLTEEICGKILEDNSGLKCGVDFTLGYSPERINPGDKEHTFESIVKVVAGQDERTLKILADLYGKVVKAGIHKAPSIKVAEAAKVIENTQRDINIAFMNELSIIFDRMGISCRDVLDAASTKWNFLRFTPGLVGGHCIGVDPYYLTTKAQQLGYHPQVILAGRRINDDMGKYVAQRTIKLVVNSGLPVLGARIGILGVTFKENVADPRNSRVPDIYRELKEFGVNVVVHDPYANADEVSSEYGIELTPLEHFLALDAIILAVNHKYYSELGQQALFAMLNKGGGVFVDVKSVVDRERIPQHVIYWSL